ncbi:hypothetical protein FH972_011013 [Carpinus fangiana]|uniref:Uncharacterized protein n=1 Tax=Carpinus fangiana TaxID=176857 RepID=A0A660KQ14_9ROSI|nr:hypothetical protein FH972_011013 [Carpinus fangiana]
MKGKMTKVIRLSAQRFRTSLLGENFAVFCGASGNKFLFSSENKHLTTWLPRSLDQNFLFPTDAKHSTKAEATKMRAIRPDFLKPEALQHYIPIMYSMSKQHLETNRLTPCKELKLFPLSKKYSFALACRLFMNIQDNEQVTRFANPFNLVTVGFVSIPVNVVLGIG